MSQEDYYPIPGSVLAVGLTLAFAMWAPLLAVPPLESTLARELGISHALVSLLYSGPIIVLALAAVPSGLLADAMGLEKTIGVGATIIALGSFLRGFGGSFPALMGATLVYGLGLGIAFPNLPKLARHCSPRSRAHVTLAIFSTAILVSGGTSLAVTRPFIYGVTGNLHATFFVWSVPAIVAAALWWRFIKDPPCQSSGAETARFDLVTLGRLLKRRELWTIAILFFLHNIFFYTWAGWMPEYLTTIGIGSNLAGFTTSVTLWVGLPSVILLSELSYRIGRRKPFLWTPSLILIFCSLAALFVNAPLSWLLMLIAGAATTIRFVIVVGLPVELVPPHQGGSASGLVMSVGYMGALLGPLAAGVILDRTASYNLIFLLLVAASALTLLLSLLASETGPGRVKAPAR